MSDPRPAIALHILEREFAELPGGDARCLVVNAQSAIRWPEGFPAQVAYVQDLRPGYLALENRGCDVHPVPQGSDFDLTVILAGRHRRQNETWIADALSRTRSGGTILVAGMKTDGMASLKKRVGALLALAGAQSKFHGMAFWLERPRNAQTAIDALAHETSLIDGRFETGPGMFSADGIDPGSRLLADHLPDDIKGAVADFGAGWGYLAAQLLDRQGVASLDLYEASHAALDAAKANLGDTGQVELGFFWHDLTSEPVARGYDAIVMNPPFHQGRAAEPGIGSAFVRAALGALKKGGRLFLVANSGLPYDHELKAGASASGELANDGRFRVLWATV